MTNSTASRRMRYLAHRQSAASALIGAAATFFLFLFACVGARAQQATADLLGTVTDASGAVLPGATVTVTNNGTNIANTTTTNSTGDYSFTFLQVGTYTVKVQANGFKAFAAPSVNLSAGDHARIDAKMEVGDVSQTVEVSGTITPALQTDSSDVGSTVDDKAVQDLPLDGRNYINLVQDQAGVNPGPATSMSGGTRPDDRRQSSAFSANGQPETQNAQLLDGLDNIDRQQGGLGVRPSVDGIQEVKVDTNMYSAEFSRTAGAVVNVITKSGTNQFHGSVYEFLRNDLFDARDAFAKVGVVSKPEYRQNQFGFSVGGPIRKDKTFFFADLEDLRVVQGENPVTQTVPTAFEEAHPGNFSDYCFNPSLPCTGSNLGPVLTGPLDPIGLEYFKMYPAPTPGLGTGQANSTLGAPTEGNFLYGGTRTQTGLTGDIRIDDKISDSDSIFVRYSGNPVTTFTPGIMPPTTVNGIKVDPGGASAINTSVQYPGNAIELAQGFHVNYVHIFRPNLVMELKAGYTYIKIWSLPLNYGTNVSAALGIPGVNSDQFSSGLTIMSPSGYNQPGGTIFDGLGSAAFIPILNTNHVYQYHGAVTWTTGNHVFKFGGALIRRHLDDLQEGFAQGLFAYFGPGPDPLASMLQGSPALLLRGNALFKPHYQFWEPSEYVQDDWHAKRWLTLNLGLRYDIFTQFTEEQNRFSNFNLPTLSFVLATPGNRTAGVGTDHHDVSPRVGFAATIGHNMVVRGGFGLSYTPGIQPGYNNTPYSAGFSCDPGTTGATACPAGFGKVDEGFPVPTGGSISSIPPGTSVTGHPATTYTPYVEMFNLLLQKELGANTFTVGYVGQRGHRFAIDNAVNTPAPSDVPGVQNVGPYFTRVPNISSITWREYEGVSTYDALEAVFQRRYHSGFSFNANYTWSHGLSNFLGPGVPNQANRDQLPNDLMYDYGNSDLDIRQRFVVSANYELPFGKSYTGAMAAVAKGWQINGITTWQTGQSFTVQDGASPRLNIPGVNDDRPNIAASLTVPNPSINEWFNVAAFAPQNLGTPGDEAVNQLFGPHFSRTDLSLFKTFRLTERFDLQFRTEMFNIFNHPFFNQPNATITAYTVPASVLANDATTPAGTVSTGAGGLGQINSTSPNSVAREFQFALKLLF